MQHIQLLEQLLVGDVPIRFNRRTSTLHIDMDWTIVGPGQYLVIECYMIADPTVNTSIWGDRWLQKYATQMIKQQWGENLSKFSNIPLPGGAVFNGDKIYNDATNEIIKLEEVMTRTNVPQSIWTG